MTDAISHRQASIFVIMLTFGVTLASWVTRTPAVRDALDASTGQMGLVLFGMSVGAMVGVLASGRAVSRIGARPVVALGMLTSMTALVIVGVSTAFALAWGVFGGLMLLGFSGGFSEIAANVEGAAIEKVKGRPFLPALHGAFSLGTVIGAVLGIVFTAINFPVLWHLLSVAAVLSLTILWALPGIPGGIGIDKTPKQDTSTTTTTQPSPLWKDKNLLIIGMIVLAMAFAEGSANDWLPILIVDHHGQGEVYGSLVFTGFAAMMTVGRFLGGPLVAKFGRGEMLAASAVMGILGVLGVVFAPTIAVAIAAVVLWGLGASLGFPVAISAAGDNPDRPTQRVSFVATSGYFAFLVGPPLLGFLGDHIGIGSALLVVVGLLLGATYCGIQVGRTSRQDNRHRTLQAH